MWFKILFYPNMPHVSAAFGEDGTIYFKATDVGKLLGYSNKYHFSTTHSSTDLNLKIPSRLRTAKKNMVMTFEEILKKIVYAGSKKKTSISLEDFYSLWHNGREPTGAVPNFPILESKFLPLLRIERDAKFHIQDWIAAYKMVVMRFYEHIRRMEDSCTSDNAAHLEVPPSSVESDYYYEPPQDDMFIDEPDCVIDETNLVIDETNLGSNLEDMKSSDFEGSRSSDHEGRPSSLYETESSRIRELPNVEKPDLKMYFETFPPTRIQIQIQDTKFEYMLIT